MPFCIYTAQCPIPDVLSAQLLSLMREAFPAEERRMDEEYRRLFKHQNVQILCAREEERLNGFLLFWVLEHFVFVENFAVLPAARGLGLGSAMLQQLKSHYDLPLILEVEPPEDELTRRRVAFYQRNGYHLNGYEYYLPCLHESIPRSIQLKIMSAPEPLSDECCKKVIEALYSTVYQGKPVRK